VVMTTLFFWVVTPCRLASRYRRFGETSCLQDDDDPNDEESTHLWNVDLLQRDYTTLCIPEGCNLTTFTLCTVFIKHLL